MTWTSFVGDRNRYELTGSRLINCPPYRNSGPTLSVRPCPPAAGSPGFQTPWGLPFIHGKICLPSTSHRLDRGSVLHSRCPSFQGIPFMEAEPRVPKLRPTKPARWVSVIYPDLRLDLNQRAIQRTGVCLLDVLNHLTCLLWINTFPPNANHPLFGKCKVVLSLTIHFSNFALASHRLRVKIDLT